MLKSIVCPLWVDQDTILLTANVWKGWETNLFKLEENISHEMVPSGSQKDSLRAACLKPLVYFSMLQMGFRHWIIQQDFPSSHMTRKAGHKFSLSKKIWLLCSPDLNLPDYVGFHWQEGQPVTTQYQGLVEGYQCEYEATLKLCSLLKGVLLHGFDLFVQYFENVLDISYHNSCFPIWATRTKVFKIWNLAIWTYL